MAAHLPNSDAATLDAPTRATAVKEFGAIAQALQEVK
jgi:hypothetical protein